MKTGRGFKLKKRKSISWKPRSCTGLQNLPRIQEGGSIWLLKTHPMRGLNTGLNSSLAIREFRQNSRSKMLTMMLKRWKTLFQTVQYLILIMCMKHLRLNSLIWREILLDMSLETFRHLWFLIILSHKTNMTTISILTWGDLKWKGSWISRAPLNLSEMFSSLTSGKRWEKRLSSWKKSTLMPRVMRQKLCCFLIVA